MKNWIYAIVAGACMLQCVELSAVPIIQETWESDMAGWVGSYDGSDTDDGFATWDNGQVAVSLFGFTGAGFLRTSVAPSDNITTNLNLYQFVTFELETTGTAPDALALYFGSGNGHYYTYVWNVNSIPATGVSTFSAGLGATSWNPFNGGSEANFLSDLDNATWLGIYVMNPGTAVGEVIYKFDNLTLAVPEPETVWMILAVVLSLGMTFRHRFAGLIGQLKIRIAKA
jgi:hypothetical protein